MADTQQMDFTDKVVVVTGSGGALGKSYCDFLASRGANVCINDLGREAADAAVAAINSRNGGRAIANYNSVTDGAEIIKQAFDKWGRIDILINNAGILRDKSFKAMTDKEWDIIHDVHVKGAYACTKAAWPIMRKQKFGRIINVSKESRWSPTIRIWNRMRLLPNSLQFIDYLSYPSIPIPLLIPLGKLEKKFDIRNLKTTSEN